MDHVTPSGSSKARHRAWPYIALLAAALILLIDSLLYLYKDWSLWMKISDRLTTHAAGHGIFIFAIVVAALFGALSAIAELLPRYKDEPFRAAFCRPGLLYLGFNAIVSVAAFLTLLVTMDHGTALKASDYLQYAIAGGLGGVLLLRTTVVFPKGEGPAAQIGPGNVIIAFQNSIDRQIDRVRAQKRAQLVKEYMCGRDFDRTKLYVLTIVTGSMQNLTMAEQEELGKKVGEIEIGKTTTNQEKSYALGFHVLNKLGEVGLRELFDNTNDVYARVPLSSKLPAVVPAVVPTGGAAPLAPVPAALNPLPPVAPEEATRRATRAQWVLRVADTLKFTEATTQLNTTVQENKLTAPDATKVKSIVAKYAGLPADDSSLTTSDLAAEVFDAIGVEPFKIAFRL